MRPRRWRSPLLAAVAVLVGVLCAAGLLASCGVPTMREPVGLDAGLVPPPRSTDPEAQAPDGLPTAPRLYFVEGDDGLQAVRGDSVAVMPSEQARAMLAQLMRGPTEAELAAGLSSAIPPGLSLRLAALAGGLATVDVEGTDPGPGGNASHLLPGQVVLSLTSLPFVDAVMLTRNGRPLEAALPDGALTELPLSRTDYSSLIIR